MDDNLDFETYLIISSRKLVISVNTNPNKKIYEEEIIIKDNFDNLNFEKLIFFLDKNIFKIEKKLKNFVKKISIILDLDCFFSIDISIKKNNYENKVNINALKHILYEAKDDCKKTRLGKEILHMTIENYYFDGQNYSYLPDNIKCQNFSLDIKFLCVSTKIIKNLEKILKQYQISINRIVSAKYINSFLNDDEKDIFFMAKEIIDGYNPNEVMMIDKSTKNQGFFEKFFNFFN